MRTASRRNTRVSLRRQASLVDMWRGLVKDLFDPYRPELHYMRGPGPKWREKHMPKAAPAHLNGVLAHAAA